MKMASQILFIFIISSFVFQLTSAACTGTATYRLNINYIWSAPGFPNTPSSAHFSPLVVHSHESRYSAYSRFGYASTGVKDVAEFGGTTQLESELSIAQNAQQVLEFKVDPSAPGGDGSVAIDINVSCRHRHISAITMVAPSPDWFLAIFRLNVVKKDMFIQSKSGTLKVYDAGTDSGDNLTSPNQLSVPVQNISPLAGAPFFRRHLATYTLTKM